MHHGGLLPSRHTQSLRNARSVECYLRADARAMHLHPRGAQVVREVVAGLRIAVPFLPLSTGGHDAAVEHG